MKPDILGWDILLFADSPVNIITHFVMSASVMAIFEQCLAARHQVAGALCGIICTCHLVTYRTSSEIYSV